MRKIGLICLVLIISCHHNKKGMNFKIIPEDKFVNLLVDYHLAVSVSYSESYKQKSKNLKPMNINDTVLKSYGYTRAIFDSSVSFYSGNPEKYDAIYDKVIARLSKMQAEIEQKMAKNNTEEQKKLVKQGAELKKNTVKREKVIDSTDKKLLQDRMKMLREKIIKQNKPLKIPTLPTKPK